MRTLGALALVGWVVSLHGCGGSTSTDASAGGAAGSAGASSTGGSSGASGSAGSSGNGGGSGGSGGVQCGPVAPAEPCNELAEVGCMAAFPRCVPSYDDACCSSCNPGPCADCTKWQFYACLPFEESNCTPGTIPHCAHTPTWACQGSEQTECAQAACDQTPGCVAATPSCPPDQYCPTECHPLAASSCGPACAGSAPSCATGVPESEDGSFTGACIPETVCKLAPPCPAEAPINQTCPVLGQFCQYGPACGGTFCTCTSGEWECYSTPC